MKITIKAFTNLKNLEITNLEFTTNSGRPVVATLSNTDYSISGSEYLAVSEVNFRYCDKDNSDNEIIPMSELAYINLTNILYNNISIDEIFDDVQDIIILDSIEFEEKISNVYDHTLSMNLNNLDLVYFPQFTDSRITSLKDVLLFDIDNKSNKLEIYKLLNKIGYDLLVFRCKECANDMNEYNPYVYDDRTLIPFNKIKLIIVDNHDTDCENSEINMHETPQRMAPVKLYELDN